MTRCARCDAELSAWEVRKAEKFGVPPCWCDGVPPGTSRTLANIAYAELCHTGLTQPIRIHDVVRFVGQKYARNPGDSINVALSQDKRFCWGGRALYGLARHGLIPGARSLAEAAYAVLLAAPRELYVEEVDFVLEQLNYRFNSDSLAHHLRGHTSNRWNLTFKINHWKRVWVNTGRDARHEYNAIVRVCPTQVAFDSWVEDDLTPKVERTLDDRTRRLAELNGVQIDIPGDRIEFQ
jgi:hypothetical protein